MDGGKDQEVRESCEVERRLAQMTYLWRQGVVYERGQLILQLDWRMTQFLRNANGDMGKSRGSLR